MLTRAIVLSALCLIVTGLGSAPSRADMVASSEQLLPNKGSSSRRLLIESDATLHATARCVVKRAGGQSTYLLQTVPGSDAETKMVYSLQSSMNWCMPGGKHNGLRAPINIMRGALAEELYHAQYGSVGELPPTAGPATWEYPFSSADKGDSGRMMLEQTGRCMVRRSPMSVNALLVTEPFSPQETTAVAGLASALGACMTVGSTARLSRQSLRGLLAEALYEYAGGLRSGFGLGIPSSASAKN